MLDAAVDAIRSGRNQYPPGRGVPELREAIVRHQRHWYGLSYDADTEVLVTAGATEAIAAACLALCEPGDEVVVLEPTYDSYQASIAMSGATPVFVTLRPPGYRLDVEALRAAVTPRTRLLLVNSPHNPTGTVLDGDELGAIAALAVERDLLVVTDEVYEHLTFDGLAHVPLATYPGMRERTVTISSGGKTFNTTGWKVGWLCAPAPLVTAVTTAKQFLTYVNAGPLQPAIAVGLDLPDRYFADLAADLAAKRDLLCAGLDAAGFAVFRPQGTYFVTVDIQPLRPDGDGMAFCRELPARCGVVAVPNQVFYGRPDGRSAPGALLVRQARRGAGRGRRPPVDPGGRCRRRCRSADRHGGRGWGAGGVRYVRGARGGGAVVKVAVVQHDVVWEDKPANFARLAPQVAAAAAAGARLVVLTEMFSTGFSMRTEVVAEPEGGPSSQFLVEQAAAHGIWVCGSCAEVPRPGERPFNTLVLAGPDGTVHRYRKNHLFAYGGEDRSFSPGDELVTVEVEGLRISPFVCYDLRFADDWWQVAPATDLYLCVASWPKARRQHWSALLRARAIENQAYVIGANRVGSGGGVDHMGDSAVVDPLGEVLASGSRGEALLVAEVDAAQVAKVRADLPFLADRRDAGDAAPI